jgi:hypothetical protein
LRTNSSSLLSITEERAHASARRIWLVLAMVVEKIARGDGRQRSNGGSARWLKGAKEAKEVKKAKMQKAYRGHMEPQASQLYLDGRPTGG